MEYIVKIILIIFFVLIFVKLYISKEFFENSNLIIILNGLPSLISNKNCSKSNNYKKNFYYRQHLYNTKFSKQYNNKKC